MNFDTAKGIAANISKIAQYTTELELIKADLIERWPKRSAFLKQQIAQCESILADWFQLIRDKRCCLLAIFALSCLISFSR